MKNLVFAVVAAVSVLFLSGCVSGNRYVIEGAGESLVDGHWMYVMDGEDWSILDSARIENGSFRKRDLISAHRQLFCIWEQIPLRPGFTR